MRRWNNRPESVLLGSVMHIVHSGPDIQYRVGRRHNSLHKQPIGSFERLITT